MLTCTEALRGHSSMQVCALIVCAVAHARTRSVFRGARATCFAYGQTGSGKTHTMLGSDSGDDGLYVLVSAAVSTRQASHART
jgi:hypothetical protein